MTIDPIIPLTWVILLACGLTFLTLWAHLRAGRQLGKLRNGFLTLIRLTAVLIIVALLLRLSREESITPPTVERSLLIAIDSSASMEENETSGVSRLDQARKTLEEADLLEEDSPFVQYHLFDTKALVSSVEGVRNMAPVGDSTLFHSSLRQIFRSHQGVPPAALVLLSDGHDLEAIPPGHSARLARNRQCPIYTIPFGKGGSTRDLSIRVANFHPYTFRKQQTRLAVTLRTVGCARESITIDLLREDKVVQSKRIETGDQSFHDVEFMVSEDEPGQVEYAFRARPVANELVTTNNYAVSYLNILDEKIRILMIEGSPYWDTTFLRRSLARNDKLDTDALVRFSPNKTRAIRANKNRESVPLKAPSSVEDLLPYKAVILGRNTDTILGKRGIKALEEWVDKQGGIVIFSRGKAWMNTDIESPLEPIEWGNVTTTSHIEVPRSAHALPPFKFLHNKTAGQTLPPVLSYHPVGKPKTLAAFYVETENAEAGVVFRRMGRGQTLSLGLANLWKWVFNSTTEHDNNLYDLFWDQLLLWMLANGGVNPSMGYTFQTNTANLAAGEEITFSLLLNGLEPPKETPSVTLTHGKEQAAILALSPNDNGDSWSAKFTPRAEGRHSAEIILPNGEKDTARFMVYKEEQERTETATDLAYLSQLASASGGRMIQPAELKDLVSSILLESTPMETRTRLIPVWDKALICLIIAFLLALEWFLRRRWGLT